MSSVVVMILMTELACDVYRYKFLSGYSSEGGANIAEGDITGNTKNQNNNTIFVTEAIYPDVDGTIHFELARYAGEVCSYQCNEN